MDLQLHDKKVLITGSTAGIGYAIAEGMAAEGAQVIINGRTQKSVDQALNTLKEKTSSQIDGFAGDLSTSEDTRALTFTHSEVDILVNNLGIFEPAPFEEISDDDWRRFFEVNVLSAIRLSRQYLQAMRQKDWGRIIFLSSESGVQIPVEMIHYGMTKTALLAVSRGLAEHVAGTGITVNSVLPGPTKSRGVLDFVAELAEKEDQSFEEFEKEFFTKMRPSSLIQRFAEPAEVASLVCYLASPLASATTGAALRVDGGVVRSAF